MLETLSQKKALADGVLDLQGNLDEISLRSGKQAFLAKLQQLISAAPQSPNPETPKKKVLPADRALGFSNETKELLKESLVRCEERYPRDGAHSVLYVVVDRDAAAWREKLTAVHQEYFGPGQSDPLAPVQLEVIDRATDEAIQRLIAAGLITPRTRAARPLQDGQSTGKGQAELSEGERSRSSSYRAQAARKLKMAQVLGGEGFLDEARPALIEAIQCLARALAVEHRYPEPGDLKDALQAPLSHCWRETLPLVRQFAENGDDSWQVVAQALQPSLGDDNTTR